MKLTLKPFGDSSFVKLKSREKNDNFTTMIPKYENDSCFENGIDSESNGDEGSMGNTNFDKIAQAMDCHPKYLRVYMCMHNYLMNGEGPLPFDYRHYIAIMAAARHKCTFLISCEISNFLLVGGNRDWLHGLGNIPQKLRDLSELNYILAHQPWLIKTRHIQSLAKGKNKWTVPELLQAITIMTSYHALTSFLVGSGVSYIREVSRENSVGSTSPVSSHLSQNGLSDLEGGIDALIEKMKKISEEGDDEITEEDVITHFQNIEQQNVDIATSVKITRKSDCECFVVKPEFTYEDFAKRSPSAHVQTFRIQDYSWEDNGYSLANHFYRDIGTLLDNKFSLASTLTYNTMGNKEDVNTSSFRTAIWKYIHVLFGIRHDDYDYAQVNQLVDRDLKHYIKTVTCFPDSVARHRYTSVLQELKKSEKIHINLMVLEARLQAELLYALRALTNHMT